MTKVTRHNFRNLFEKALRDGERAVERLIAAYLWAKNNSAQAKSEWKEWTLESGRERVRQSIGLDPESFLRLCNDYGQGDIKTGAARVQEVGIANAAKGRLVMSATEFRKNVTAADHLDPKRFAKEILAAEKRTRDAASRLAKKRVEKDRERARNGDRYSEASKLKAENARLRNRIEELKSENEKLRKALALIKRDLQEV